MTQAMWSLYAWRQLGTFSAIIRWACWFSVDSSIAVFLRSGASNQCISPLMQTNTSSRCHRQFEYQW